MPTFLDPPPVPTSYSQALEVLLELSGTIAYPTPYLEEGTERALADLAHDLDARPEPLARRNGVARTRPYVDPALRLPPARLGWNGMGRDSTHDGGVSGLGT